MSIAFDSISIRLSSSEEIKRLAKRTCCKRRNTLQPARSGQIELPESQTWSCPEMYTCSCGEVKKAETINYRSFRPEPEGLFCEAIFGPHKDWECNCGKYKRIKHKGVICDRCGVEVVKQHVRRERMGYIQLAAPVSHIWFFKGVPSRIGTFCQLSSREVERVIYFEAFIVTEVDEDLKKEGILERLDVLNEADYEQAKLRYPGRFKAEAGAEVILKLLQDIDLEAEQEKLHQELEETTSRQKRLKLAKQLKQLADFIESGQRPEWMILDVLPVIPPDLRPLVTLDGGRFATSDLNDLYRRLINRNNRLRKLILIRSPEVILRNEKRMLQEAVDAYLDNGRHGRYVTGPGNRPLKSISDILKGKVGRFRQNLLGKRVDYSGRSVIVVGPELALHQCGLPKRMAVELFKPFIIERLQAYGHTGTMKRAKFMTEHTQPDSPVWEVLEEVIAEHPVLLNRPPTLHRLGIQAFLPVLVEGKSIRIPPLVCKAFNADFDGDQMAVHVPLTAEAQAEAKLLMLSSHNILKPSHGEPIAVPELDMVLGPSFLTKALPTHDADAARLHAAYRSGEPAQFEAFRGCAWYHRRYQHTDEVIASYAAGQLKLHDSLQVFFKPNGTQAREPILTTVGRVILNEVIPDELEWTDAHSGQRLAFFNMEVGGRQLSALVQRCFNELGTRTTTEVLSNLQKLAFEYATLSGISPGIKDYILPENRDNLVNEAQAAVDRLIDTARGSNIEELENERIRLWFEAIEKIEETMFETLPNLETYLVERDEYVKGFSPVYVMADSGARARKNPFMQISAVVGLKARQSGEILSAPIKSSYREGLDVLDYFNSTYGSRKGLVDTAMKTAASGYLTRKLVDVAQDVRITEEDCKTMASFQKFTTEGGTLAFKIDGRTAAEEIVHPDTGEVLVPADTVISTTAAEQIGACGIKVVKVRSVLTCETERGVCAKCYGNDLTTGKLAHVGEAVGIIAAQSIGEPGTQLTMRTFHTGGAVEQASDAPQREILAKTSGTIHFRDFHPGSTVRQEGELWVAVENRADLDGAAYKVKQVNHPDCQLQPGELLSEKQFSENTTRYKGFETQAWQYRITAVNDSRCPLKIDDRLSYALYEEARRLYGFHQYVTERKTVIEVRHPDIAVAVGALLTNDEVERLKSNIQERFEGEWRYLNVDTGEFLAADKLTPIAATAVEPQISVANRSATDNDSDAVDTANTRKFKRLYYITACHDVAFPFSVGDTVAEEDIRPWLTPFDMDAKSLYVVNPDAPLHAGDNLTEREYEEVRLTYQPFETERADTVSHVVTRVHHPDCPLNVGDVLTTNKLRLAHKRFPGFDAPKLRHRITYVYHPECPLTPGTLISDVEAREALRNYPGLEATETVIATGSLETERLSRVTGVHHPDCPLQVDEVLTRKEINLNRRRYRGFDVERSYELKDGEVLTESEYKTRRKMEPELKELVTGSCYRVTGVHHPKLILTLGTELLEKEYRKLQREYKAFDVESVYRVIADTRETNRLDAGEFLTDAEHRAIQKQNRYVSYTVTAVYHPSCQHSVGEKLSEAAYQHATAQYAGFDKDELALRMHIEIETPDGHREPHLIPAGYSFSVKEGESVRAENTLAQRHEKTVNRDIVAGIPRVTELFEARRPKREDAAEIAEIEGVIQAVGTKAGVPVYRIVHEEYESRTYPIPDEKRRITPGDWVNAGEPLTDGYRNPHDILKIGRTLIEGIPLEGEEAVSAYLVDEVQKVYGAGTINDKHVETIVRQMLTKIRITEPGDTSFHTNDEVQRDRFYRVNAEKDAAGNTPATGEPILQGISKASLSTDSFISAASFQQTTKVLTDAAVSGQTDTLFGLKENVILGRLIPAGSGFSAFQNLEVAPHESELPATEND